MCLFVLRGIELKVGMGVGDRPMRFESIFSKLPYQRSKCYFGPILPKVAPFVSILLLTNIFQRGYFVKFGGGFALSPLYFEPCPRVISSYDNDIKLEVCINTNIKKRSLIPVDPRR